MYKWWHCARVIVCTARTSLQKGRMGVSEGRPLWRRMKGSSHVSTARDYDVVISQFLYVPSRLSLSTAMTHCPSVHSAASPPDLCPLPRTSGRRHSLPVTPRPISFAHARGRPRAGRGAANVRRVPPYFRRPWWYRRPWRSRDHETCKTNMVSMRRFPIWNLTSIVVQVSFQFCVNYGGHRCGSLRTNSATSLQHILWFG